MQRIYESGRCEKVVGIRLTKEQIKRVDRWARKRHLGRSTLCRQIIVDVLEQQEAKEGL